VSLLCRFLGSLRVSISSILLGCSLTNIKFINDSSQSSSTEKNEEHFTRKDPRGFKKIVGRRPKKEREREREREREMRKINYLQVSYLSCYQISKNIKISLDNLSPVIYPLFIVATKNEQINYY